MENVKILIAIVCLLFIFIDATSQNTNSEIHVIIDRINEEIIPEDDSSTLGEDALKVFSSVIVSCDRILTD